MGRRCPKSGSRSHDIDEALLLGHQIVITRAGGAIAQIGSVDGVLANPADEFVANSIGANRGKRSLRAVSTDHGDIVVDDEGHAAGLLVSDPDRVEHVDPLASLNPLNRRDAAP